MDTKDLSKMASAAVITLGITLVAALPGFIDANDDGNRVGPKIENPRLIDSGAEVRLKSADNRTFREGDEPVFELTAVNTTDQPTEITVETLMNSTANPAPRARTPSMPITLWSEPHTFSLGPQETRTITVATGTRLPANSRIDVYLRAVRAGLPLSADLVSMSSFSTTVPPAPQ